jgi:hypothetical protein
MSQWGPPTVAPAGWYGDPSGAPCLRYWNGVTWTADVSPADQTAQFQRASSSLGDDAGMRLLLPVGRSGWAIAAGYLGLVGWLIFPLAPFALITAELGRREIADDSHRHGMGRVALGYIGGTIGMVVMVFVIANALSQ